MDISNMTIDDIRQQVEEQIDFDRLEELNAQLEKDIQGHSGFLRIILPDLLPRQKPKIPSAKSCLTANTAPGRIPRRYRI